MYDGRSIALRGRMITYSYHHGENVVDAMHHDATILHEICHYIAVSDVQQQGLPDYGLAVGGDPTILICEEHVNQQGIVELQEQRTQEALAQQLSVILGMKFNIKQHPSYNFGWKTYLKLKKHEHRTRGPNFFEAWTLASARLQHMMCELDTINIP